MSSVLSGVVLLLGKLSSPVRFADGGWLLRTSGIGVDEVFLEVSEGEESELRLMTGGSCWALLVICFLPSVTTSVKVWKAS